MRLEATRELLTTHHDGGNLCVWTLTGVEPSLRTRQSVEEAALRRDLMIRWYRYQSGFKRGPRDDSENARMIKIRQ